MGKIKDEIGLKPGIISIIGGGGKTTFLHTVSQELEGTKVITTSTHFFPFDDVFTANYETKEELRQALCDHPRLALATDNGGTKQCAPVLSFDDIAEVADWVLVEADGSRNLPFKGHADHEPVIPENSNLVIQMIGGSGFGQKVKDATHRPQIFCEITNCSEEDIVTPELLAKVLVAEDLCDVLIINQAEDPHFAEIAKRLQDNVPYPVYWGSVRNSVIHKA